MNTPEIVRLRRRAKATVAAYIGERVARLQRAISRAEKQAEAAEEELAELRRGLHIGDTMLNAIRLNTKGSKCREEVRSCHQPLTTLSADIRSRRSRRRSSLRREPIGRLSGC